MYVCMYVLVCMYVGMYVCMYVLVCRGMYVCNLCVIDVYVRRTDVSYRKVLYDTTLSIKEYDTT